MSRIKHLRRNTIGVPPVCMQLFAINESAYSLAYQILTSWHKSHVAHSYTQISLKHPVWHIVIKSLKV